MKELAIKALTEKVGPFVIEPRGVYRPADLVRGLGLAKTTISREIRRGRLRVTRRGGKYFVMGTWAIQWLEAGEVHRRERAEVQA